MVLPVLLPLLKQRLNVSFLDLGLALTAFNVVTGLTALAGFLVDRIGARPVLVAGLILGGLSFFSIAFVAPIHGCWWPPSWPAPTASITPPTTRSSPTDLGDQGGRAFSITPCGLSAAPSRRQSSDPCRLGGLEAALMVAGIGFAIALLVFLIPNQQPSLGRARAGRCRRSRRQHRRRADAWRVGDDRLLHAGPVEQRHLQPGALMATHGVAFAAANTALAAYLACSAIGVLLGGWLADRTTRHGHVAALGFTSPLQSCCSLPP